MKLLTMPRWQRDRSTSPVGDSSVGILQRFIRAIHRPVGVDLSIAIGATLAVALMAMAVIFSLAHGTSLVAATSTAGIYEEASLSVAATTRNGVIQAQLIGEAYAAGISSEDDVAHSLQRVEDASAELLQRTAQLAEELDGSSAARRISSDTAAFTDATALVVDLIQSGDLVASADVIGTDLVSTYEALVGFLAVQRDEDLALIALTRDDSGRLADAARVLVALLLPLGLLLAYRARSRRETRRVTERAEEATIYQATHDSLTGLINRTLLKDRLDVALADARRSGEKVAIMFVDLDRFKLVNDSAGHSVGDELLLNVADRILTLVREGDSVARVGGDEFVLLMTRIADDRETINVAERVVSGIRHTWKVAAREFIVTASAGIAVFPDDGDDPESLLRNADTAMYRAKDQGRDTFQVFSADMNREIEERVTLEHGLRQAIARDEFSLHYQPQVTDRTGEIVGLEALIRWNHAERGLVLPDEFIDVVEETGLIFPIGQWVLETACEQLVAWRNLGLGEGIAVAVNVSARQFQDPQFIENVKATLHRTGLPPASLDVEITESVAMRDVAHSVRTLEALSRLGVRVSIDDFGTGYSSLAYLRQFPIDTVKIDRSFITNIVASPDSAAIVAAIISLADTLGMTTVAEGVETEEQLAFLEDRQCPVYQGFIFSRPLPADQIEGILAQASLLDGSTTALAAALPIDDGGP